MKLIVEIIVILLFTLQYASAIKCRTCLPCEEKYKKLFKIREDEIVDNCGVCITAYSTYHGYEMEGRGCLPKCPTKSKYNELTPGLVSKFDCCYYDLCNSASRYSLLHLQLLWLSCFLSIGVYLMNRIIS
uniref:UPAR/Ly6 domain-containing protein n=1 Tax=Trichobilharzia regenti TaxID=157069 RepID=A0AA85JXW1_TRIRE|nr:unnamed protein product [Trichobilharzia regenti]